MEVIIIIIQICLFLKAGADPTIEDRNHRIPLDEAVLANKPGRKSNWKNLDFI